MKIYAQFYTMSVDWDGQHPSRPIPACGDRSVIILDGRESTDSHKSIAATECHKRGYVGWELRRADGFNRPYTAVSRSAPEMKE